MTKEEKELLTKVLCEQLPYGVIVNATYKDGDGWKNNDRKLLGVYQHDGQVYLDGVYTSIHNVKPYLRPLSSMTQIEARDISEMGLHIPAKEIISVNVIANGIAITFENLGLRDRQTEVYPFDRIVCSLDIFDYLNKKHFGIRGLIPMGLAIAAVGENDPYMKKGGVE